MMTQTNLNSKLGQLAEMIEDEFAVSRWDKDLPFLPVSAQEDLITEENVGRVASINALPPLKDMKEVLSMLILLKDPDLLNQLCAEGLRDVNLPLERIGTCTLLTKEKKVLEVPRDRLCKKLVSEQWKCHVPVFDGAKGFSGMGEFHGSSILPIIHKGKPLGKGGFGQVWEVIVHPSHLKNSPLVDKETPDDPPKAGFVVAIKRMSGGPDAAAGNARDEENAFIEAQSLIGDHENLIKMICSFRRGDEYFFVLPLAEGGDLINLWKRLDCERRSEELIKWILSQMEGIAGAISCLNGPKEGKPGGKNARHGDLKPENILHFHLGGHEKFGVLRIGDLGLAKFHADVTNKRPDPTTEKRYSKPYAPPEGFKAGVWRSRRYDTWSLGCVYLELVVWIFGGFESVKRFAESRREQPTEDWQAPQEPLSEGQFKSSPFFRQEKFLKIGPKRDVRHSKVTSCCQNLRSYPRCRKSGFDELITMIEDKLLEPDFSKRYFACDVEEGFRKIWDSDAKRLKSQLYDGTTAGAMEGFEKDTEFLHF